MKKRLIAALLTVALVFAFVVVPGSAWSVNTSSDMFEALQIREHKAIQKYNSLLKLWSSDPDHYCDYNIIYPNYYAGAYINEQKDLVILVTIRNDDAKSYFESLIDLSNVEFKVVQYSLNELLSLKNEISDKYILHYQERISDQLSGVGISMADNAIKLYIIGDMNELIDYYKDRDFNQFVFETVKDKDYICSVTAYPGNKITNSGYSRSLGFWAYDSSNNLGIITAPHNNMSSGQSVYYNGTLLGTAQTPYFSGSVDAIFVKRTNTNVVASRYIGNGISITSSLYISLPVGSSAYSTGYASGYKTGTVTDVYYTTSYGLSNCVVTSAPSQSGDSGGPVAGGGTTTTKYIAGVIAGTTGAGYQISTKASNILSTLSSTVY